MQKHGQRKTGVQRERKDKAERDTELQREWGEKERSKQRKRVSDKGRWGENEIESETD